MNERIM